MYCHLLPVLKNGGRWELGWDHDKSPYTYKCNSPSDKPPMAGWKASVHAPLPLQLPVITYL